MKILLAVPALAACLCAQAPDYTSAGVVNGASFTPGLAPNTIASIFGTNLSWDTVVLRSDDISGDTMPTTLGNVGVYLEGWPAYLFYVSPTQINFLVPSPLLPGNFSLWVTRQGMVGPIVQVTLQDTAPALFQTPAGAAIASHLDGSLVTSDAPARAGEIVMLWATGLGATLPPLEDGMLPGAAQWLAEFKQFSVWVAGAPIDPGLVMYAGVAPGYAGLYQINVRLPDPLPPNPQLQVAAGNTLSPPGLILPAN